MQLKSCNIGPNYRETKRSSKILKVCTHVPRTQCKPDTQEIVKSSVHHHGIAICTRWGIRHYSQWVRAVLPLRSRM